CPPIWIVDPPVHSEIAARDRSRLELRHRPQVQTVVGNIRNLCPVGRNREHAARKGSQRLPFWARDQEPSDRRRRRGWLEGPSRGRRKRSNEDGCCKSGQPASPEARG